MNINRHNYEEFFLLYVDNELSAADRKAVDVFVQQNPDLKGELDLLKQSIIGMDTIVFDNKNALLKDEGITALQENLLAYLDNELKGADKSAVEKLIAADAAATKEFAILQQTKLPVDTSIVFEDKKSLYRTAGGKVVYFPWKRTAAAAILLGFGIWAGVAYLNREPVNGNGEVAKGNEIKNPVTKQPYNKVPVQLPAQINTTDDKNTVADNQTNSTKQTIQKSNVPAEKIIKRDLPVQPDNNNTVVKQEDRNNKPSNNLARPLDNINNRPGNNDDVAIVIPEKNNNSGNDVAQPKPIETTNNAYALTTAYNDNNAEEKNDNRILFMDEEKVKKTKLGGFFRKVKRVIERTANIKTGNGIKVAGFDIAIK